VRCSSLQLYEKAYSAALLAHTDLTFMIPVRVLCGN
jgi:hypothetical protein